MHVCRNDENPMWPGVKCKFLTAVSSRPRISLLPAHSRSRKYLLNQVLNKIINRSFHIPLIPECDLSDK